MNSGQRTPRYPAPCRRHRRAHLRRLPRAPRPGRLQGVYDPGNPLSDEQGFRRDVIDALRPLRCRWFATRRQLRVGYDWRDGSAPRARPRRPDFAWRHRDEPVRHRRVHGLVQRARDRADDGGEPRHRRGQEAAELLEYCNLPAARASPDRAGNGHPEPYGVKLWCLGNEMDGPWQAGHVSAATYAERASAAGALMKGLDPTIETVGCGSSTNWLPTYPEWDRIVLEECWNHIDYISAHHYSRNDEDDTASFLAQGIELDAIITQYRGLLDHVRALKRSFHRVHVSFDEWNVWYREMPPEGTSRSTPPARGDLQPPGRPRVRAVPPRVPPPR